MVLRRALLFCLRSNTSAVRAASRKKALTALLATLHASTASVIGVNHTNSTGTLVDNYTSPESLSFDGLQIPVHIASTNTQNARPNEPDPMECCGNGCNDCVWTEYSERIAEWELKGGKI